MHNLDKTFVLGTAQFGLDYGISNKSGKVEKTEIKKILDYAKSVGIFSFDTASGYSNAANILGELADSSSKFTTKISSQFDYSIRAVHEFRSSVLEEASRLRCKTIENLLFHDLAILDNPFMSAILREVERLKSDRVIKNFGWSLYNLQELKKVKKVSDFQILQLPCNPFDQEMSSSEDLESLFKQGVKVQARSLFLQGLLLMPICQLDKYFHRWKKAFVSWDKWCESSLEGKIDACLTHALSLNCVSEIVIGITSASELEQILFRYNKCNPATLVQFKNDDKLLTDPRNWVV